MNNDLISREALKKCAIPCQIHNGTLTDLCVPLYQIDNAPAVEPRIEYGTDGQPYRLFMSGGQVVPDTLQGWRYEERPQGEWLIEGGTTFHFSCSQCGCAGDKWDKFCRHCGAKMQKGDAE